MLRAREVVSSPVVVNAKSPRANIGGLTFWLILAPGYGGSRAASTIVMVGERLRNPIIGSQTSPVR